MTGNTRQGEDHAQVPGEWTADGRGPGGPAVRGGSTERPLAALTDVERLTELIVDAVSDWFESTGTEDLPEAIAAALAPHVVLRSEYDLLLAEARVVSESVLRDALGHARRPDWYPQPTIALLPGMGYAYLIALGVGGLVIVFANWLGRRDDRRYWASRDDDHAEIAGRS
jgi:hypothetical protein